MPTSAVLLVSNYSNRTGYAWNNIHELYSELARACRQRSERVLVSFASVEGEVDCIDTAAINGVFVLPPVPTTIQEYFQWARTLRNENIRYVYFTDQGQVALRYAVFRACGVKRIVVHSRISVPDPMPARPATGPRGAAKWLISRLPWFRADVVYTVSDFVRHRLIVRGRFPAKRIRTILNGIDLERFHPVPPHEPEDRPITIYVGSRATVHKGIDVLIRAVAAIDAMDGASPDFHVRYAGDGPDMSLFRQLAAELGVESKVEFLGEQPSTEQLVADADIVVVPSVWGDACPSAVSEALAAGKPLIATRVGGVPELIGRDENALIVEHGNVGALAHALLRLMKDRGLRERLGQRGRNRAEQALDQRRYHEEVCNRLLEDFGL
jgi:glycosyltransferase involved in cell wall biosynthesis